MIKNIVERDLKNRYIGSILGFLWTILNPLSQIVIYYYVFSIVLKVKLGDEYQNVNFAMWLVCGLLPWMMFGEVMGKVTNVILDNANLITKTVFPSEILPFSTLCSGIINHLIALILVFIFGLAFSVIKISVVTPIFLVYLFCMLMFILGLGWILASLNVFIRDIGQFIGIVLNLWFYWTPIIYPIKAIPGKYWFWLKINPVYHVVEGYRASLLSIGSFPIKGMIYLFVVSLFTFLIGGIIFKKLKYSFSDVL